VQSLCHLSPILAVLSPARGPKHLAKVGGQLLSPNNHQRPNVQVLSIKSRERQRHWQLQSVAGALSIMDKAGIAIQPKIGQKLGSLRGKLKRAPG